MTNQFTVGQKVTLITNNPSYSAFRGPNVIDGPQVGDELTVVSIEDDGDIACSFEGFRRGGGLVEKQFVNPKDVSPIVKGSTAVINVDDTSVPCYFPRPLKGREVEILEFQLNPFHGLLTKAKLKDGSIRQWIDIDSLVFTPSEEAEEKTEEPIVKKEPQQPTAEMTKKVLKLLQAKRTMTPIECSAVLKCRAVPYQIHALRKLGWKIKSELKNDPIDGQRYVRYHLLDQEAA